MSNLPHSLFDGECGGGRSALSLLDAERPGTCSYGDRGNEWGGEQGDLCVGVCQGVGQVAV